MKRTPLSRSKTPMRRGKGLRRGGRLRPVSARRRKRDSVYEAARQAVVRRSGGVCEAGSFDCTGRVEQCHHRAGRVGADPHRLDNLLGVCAACHRLCHAEPALAFQMGWSVRRNGVAA